MHWLISAPLYEPSLRHLSLARLHVNNSQPKLFPNHHTIPSGMLFNGNEIRSISCASAGVIKETKNKDNRVEKPDFSLISPFLHMQHNICTNEYGKS